MLGNFEGRHEKLRDTVARLGDELAATHGRNEGLGGRVQQLEEENRLLRESSEGLKGQLARTEAGQQSAVARLQDAITAGGSKVNEDLGNVQQDIAKLKEDMIVTRWMTGKKLFPPSLKKGKDRYNHEYDVPDGIIAHLTRECGGNVHDHNVVDVTSSTALDECAFRNEASNTADLERNSYFVSDYRGKSIPHTRNNWICYDFKEKRIVPTHYTIRTWQAAHLKSWLVETSADGEKWREVAREEDNRQLNGKWYCAGTFAVEGGECRFIRLVNIGENHRGDDCLIITAWEIFGSLIE
jgi:regulator of replication initiation timing